MQEEKSVIEKTMRRIELERIRPRSKFYFLFINYFFWSAFFMCCFFAALSAGVAYHIVLEDRLYGVDKDIIKNISPFLPYFWVGLTSLFLLALHLVFRKTKGGYRMETWLAMALGVFFVGLMMFAFVRAGMAYIVHNFFSR